MEQFDQLLTCCVCLDRYRNPKLLPCQHSFCMEPCMEGLINYVTRQVKCPECRAEHRIPYQGIAAYPTNVTLQRFLELHIEITGELPDPTSGQVMERCGVCSEKNYCTLCCHCDKKVCADCKEGHLDILRREIARVNNQVRRTLPRLQDALGAIDKNSNQLQTNCLTIVEEVDGLYRRLSKALKDRTDFIKGEIEVFMAKELKALTGLRANLQHEISNFDSNSEFAEKHVTAGTTGTDGGSSISSSANTVSWDDNELMDTKDIFLRTMEFIRNFETETGDYHRRVRFFVPQDPNQLSNTLANLGELTILQGPSSSSTGQYQQGPPQPPSLGPGLMRSKSDHRVAAQFRQQEERYNSTYGSDNNDDLGGSSGRPRYFGERHGSISTRAVDRYDTSSRRNDYGDYEEPSDIGRRKFKSRFMRHHDSGDSDNEPAGRSVRFQAGETGTPDSSANKKDRQRVLDTEDAARGPLSGITRLTDSPRVIKRLQEVGRKKKPTPPSTLNLSTPAAPVHQSLPSPSSRVPPRPTAAARQVSEEDEIAKIKKQNKGQEASADSSTRKTDTSASVPSTPTGSADRPRFTSQQNSSSTEQQKAPSASRQTSTTASEKPSTESTSSSATSAPETAEEARTRRRSLLASTKSGTPTETESGSRQADRTPVTSSYAAAVASRTSSPADDASDRPSRRVGRVSTERFNKSSSESSTSAESSTHSSPVRNTGAAFSTVELKNRFGGGISGGRKSSTGSTNGDASASMATTATRSRFGNTSGGATSPSSGTGRFGTSSGTASSAATTSVASSNGTAAGVAPHRFQSRFLGRAGTPTAEASRGSENSQSSSSDDSSDSSESDSADKPATGKSAAGSKTAVASKTTPTPTKDRELARTDIGPLLARSAQARDTSTYPSSSSSNSNHTSTSSAVNSRPTTTSDSPSSYTPRSRGAAASTTSTTSSSRPYSSSSRYGTDSTTSVSALSRSRTGSALAEDMENKYPLTSKYLNRSRANLSSDTGSYGADSGGYHGSSSSASSTPRYSQTRGYQSRFLNKSKSSAALDCAPDDNSEMVDDDEDNLDDNGDDNTKSSAASAASASSAPLLVVSGDERYPSGRSRYAALKDRRSRLARSKSSHDVGPPASLAPTAPSSSSNELTVGDGVVGGKATDPQHYGQLGGEVGDTGTSSLEPTSPTAEAGSGSSLSTWARYLKNKYGPRNKEGEGQNQQPSSTTNDDSSTAGGIKQQQQAHPASRFSRARSIGVSGNNAANGRNDSDEITGPSSGLITSSSRHQYMQKRKVLMKIGTRGSEAGSFTWPRGVAVAPDNSIVVADSSNHRVQVFDSTGHFLKEFGYYGNGEGEFDCLAGVAINRIGQYIIADRYNHRIQVFDPSGRFLRVFGSQGTTDGKFSYPWGVTTDALGFIYVCDKENHRVQVFQSDGTFVGKFGTMGNRPGQLEHPHYIAVSSTNRVIVSDSNNHRIQVFDVNGKVIASFGGEGADEGQFKFPRGVAVDDQGYIVVADSGNNRIQVFTADGVFVKAFGCWGCGDGEFKGLEGIAVMSNGNIVCADRENHRIQVF